MEKLLTREEAAAYLGLSAQTLDARRKKGEIPFYKMGRRIMYKAEDLLQYAESRRVEATATGEKS